MVAEKFISFMVPILGRAPFNLAMKDQKLAFAKTIQPIINKYAVAGSGPCSEVTDNSSKYGAMLSQQSDAHVTFGVFGNALGNCVGTAR